MKFNYDSLIIDDFEDQYFGIKAQYSKTESDRAAHKLGRKMLGVELYLQFGEYVGGSLGYYLDPITRQEEIHLRDKDHKVVLFAASTDLFVSWAQTKDKTLINAVNYARQSFYTNIDKLKDAVGIPKNFDNTSIFFKSQKMRSQLWLDKIFFQGATTNEVQELITVNSRPWENADLETDTPENNLLNLDGPGYFSRQR